MSKSDNQRYLLDSAAQAYLRLWKPQLKQMLYVLPVATVALGLFMAFASKGVPAPSHAEDARTAPSLFLYGALILGATLIAFGGGLALRRLRQRRLSAALLESLQSPDPQALLTLIDSSTPSGSPVPDMDAVRAHSRALARLLYGDESAAKVELNAIAWEQRAPIIHSMASSIEALRCMLFADRYQDGLLWAKKSLAQAELGGICPAHVRDGYQGIVDIGLALTGRATNEMIAAFERRASGSRFALDRVLALFGLLQAHRARGDTDRADATRLVLLEMAPHCSPLHGTREAVPATEEPVAAPIGEPAAVAEERGYRSSGAVRKLLLYTAVSWAVVITLLLALSFFRAPR